MVLDIIALIVILWGMIRGWLRGLLFQMGQIGLLGLAYVAGRTFSEPLSDWLLALVSLPAQIGTSAAFFAIFGCVYGVGVLVLGSFTKDLHEAFESLSSNDRTLGALVGTVKGTLVVYLVLVGLIMANRATGSVPIPYASSLTGAWVMQHNFFESEEFPRAKALVKLGYLLHRKDAVTLAADPHFQAILEHPKSAILRSPEVAGALARGEWVALVQSDDLLDLLDESEIQEHLNAIEWSDGSRDGTEVPRLVLPHERLTQSP